MSATLLDLGSASLTAIGQLGRGQSVSAEDGALIFRESNLLLNQKSTQRLFLSYVSNREYTLTPGLGIYTVGPSGASFTAPRPTLIESARVRLPGTTSFWPVNILDKSKWDAIASKGAINELPNSVYPEYQFPNIVFYTNPVQSTPCIIQLGAWEALTQFATLFDIIALPPAYESWLEICLAIILAPFYDQPVPASLIDRRNEATNDVRTYNAQSMGGAISEAQRLQSPNVGAPILPAAPTGQ